MRPGNSIEMPSTTRNPTSAQSTASEPKTLPTTRAPMQPLSCWPPQRNGGAPIILWSARPHNPRPGTPGPLETTRLPHHAAVNDEGTPGDVGGLVRGEIHGQGGHLLGLAHAPERYL